MSQRAERVADVIQRELADLIREVRDPRLAAATLITLTAVRVSDDLSVARVIVSVLGGDSKGALKALVRAGGFLRREVGHRLQLRKVPELRFELDQTEERAGRIEAILRGLSSGAPTTAPTAGEVASGSDGDPVDEGQQGDEGEEGGGGGRGRPA